MAATPTPIPAPVSRRHTPFTVTSSGPRRVDRAARVTDAAGWTVKKPVGFNAAI